MALTKVTKQITDALNVAFPMLWAKMGTPPSAAADADTVMPAHALIDTAEALVNPATSDLQTTINSNLTSIDGHVDGLEGVLGTTAGAAVITDSNGTIQQYLRGIVKLLITSGTIVLGAGTAAIGKLAANSGVIIGAVEQSGTWTVQPGNTANTTAWKVDGSAVTQPISAAVPSNSTVTAYAASKVIKNAAGTFYGLSGYNSGAAQFIQLHDASALPSDTAVPVVVVKADAASNFSIDFGLRGRSFSTGIVVCNSSTGPTKTIGSADCWFDAQYI